jgi:hypothetical protein
MSLPNSVYFFGNGDDNGSHRGKTRESYTVIQKVATIIEATTFRSHADYCKASGMCPQLLSSWKIKLCPTAESNDKFILIHGVRFRPVVLEVNWFAKKLSAFQFTAFDEEMFTYMDSNPDMSHAELWQKVMELSFNHLTDNQRKVLRGSREYVERLVIAHSKLPGSPKPNSFPNPNPNPNPNPDPSPHVKVIELEILILKIQDPSYPRAVIDLSDDRSEGASEGEELSGGKGVSEGEEASVEAPRTRTLKRSIGSTLSSESTPAHTSAHTSVSAPVPVLAPAPAAVPATAPVPAPLPDPAHVDSQVKDAEANASSPLAALLAAVADKIQSPSFTRCWVREAADTADTADVADAATAAAAGAYATGTPNVTLATEVQNESKGGEVIELDSKTGSDGITVRAQP